MSFDLNNLMNTIAEETSEVKSNGNNSDNGYKLFYPFNDGKVTLKIFYNPKSGLVQRKIVRHDAGKENPKVPCFEVFGEECAVCKAVKEVSNVLGKECNVTKKYGYKVRGICYAQVIEASDSYKKGENALREGEVVTFMYPKSVFDALNDIMKDAGRNLENIVAKNESIPVVIKRETESSGFPKYTVSVYPFGPSVTFKDANGNPDDVSYDNFLNSLPNLTEQFIPKEPTDDMRVTSRALADMIKAEYFNSSVINPNQPTVAPPKVEKRATENIVETYQELPDMEIDDLPFVPSPAAPTTPAPTAPQVATSQSEDADCFGQYNETARKCLLCPKELECREKCKG